MIPFGTALTALGLDRWVLRGEPTNEQEFNEMFARFDDENNEVPGFGVTWAEAKAKHDELVAAEPLNELRRVRDALIAQTDWWASSDLVMTDERAAYRQALRDITNTYSSIEDVVWPVKPE